MSKVTKTSRGFSLIEFQDRNGVECSLQQSSIATESCVWLGCNDADPQVCISGKGWTKVEMPVNYLANTRMHLNHNQVEDLVEYLTHWLNTGEFVDSTV